MKKGYRKYRNKKTDLDGISFDSKKEADRFALLKIRLLAGEITDLVHHRRFPCKVNGYVVCEYEADFCYHDRMRGCNVIEDVKSKVTRKDPVYRLKKKLMEACNGIQIEEV